MTSPYEHNDSVHNTAQAGATHKHESSSFIFYTVQPEDKSIPSICAKLIREYRGHEAGKPELDALVADAYNRNHLITAKEREIHLGESLYFQYPIGVGKAAGKKEPAAEDKNLAARAQKPAAPQAPHDATAKPIPSSCSSYETNVVGNWVEKNEVGKRSFTAFTEDDNGNGVSVGKMQWNQRKGKLDELLRAFHDSNPQKFDGIFGKYAKDALRSDWVRHADFTQGELKTDLSKSLSAFTEVQLQLQTDQVQTACGLAKEYQLTALRGVGVIADLVNHVGPHRTRRLLHRVPGAEKATQSQRIDILEKLAEPYSVSRIASIHDTVTQMWKK